MNVDIILREEFDRRIFPSVIAREVHSAAQLDDGVHLILKIIISRNGMCGDSLYAVQLLAIDQGSGRFDLRN